MNTLANDTIDPMLWQNLTVLDPAVVAVRAGVTVSPEGVYAVPILGWQVLVDPASQRVSCVELNCPLTVGFELTMVVVLYLSGAKQILSSGRWIGPHQLKAGHFFRGHHAAPVGPIIERFGSDKNAFIARCTSLGGTMEPTAADAAFLFTFFPRIPIIVQLWQGDDEFDARAAFLIDDTADEHLKTDSILACLNIVQSALTSGPV